MLMNDDDHKRWSHQKNHSQFLITIILWTTTARSARVASNQPPALITDTCGSCVGWILFLPSCYVVDSFAWLIMKALSCKSRWRYCLVISFCVVESHTHDGNFYAIFIPSLSESHCNCHSLLFFFGFVRVEITKIAFTRIIFFLVSAHHVRWISLFILFLF